LGTPNIGIRTQGSAPFAIEVTPRYGNHHPVSIIQTSLFSFIWLQRYKAPTQRFCVVIKNIIKSDFYGGHRGYQPSYPPSR
jgi:hypothetical protein